MSSIWIIKKYKSRAVSRDKFADPASWAKTVFGDLKPGHYRVLPADCITQSRFP
jgi:hypothetical protein